MPWDGNYESLATIVTRFKLFDGLYMPEKEGL